MEWNRNSTANSFELEPTHSMQLEEVKESWRVNIEKEILMTLILLHIVLV